MVGAISLLIDSWLQVPTQLARIYFYGPGLRSRNITFGRNPCYNTNVVGVLSLIFSFSAGSVTLNFINWRSC